LTLSESSPPLPPAACRPPSPPPLPLLRPRHRLRLRRDCPLSLTSGLPSRQRTSPQQPKPRGRLSGPRAPRCCPRPPQPLSLLLPLGPCHPKLEEGRPNHSPLRGGRSLRGPTSPRFLFLPLGPSQQPGSSSSGPRSPSLSPPIPLPPPPRALRRGQRRRQRRDHSPPLLLSLPSGSGGVDGGMMWRRRSCGRPSA
jgi:hypothetical protein